MYELSFKKYLENEGYYFSKDLLENFLLSLKVKPFEIFTGNSGTGKTKLAMFFAQYIKFKSEFNKNSEVNYVKTKGKINFASWDNMGWTLEKKNLFEFLPINESESKFKMFVDGIPAEGRISISLQLAYTSTDLKNHLFQIWDGLPEESKKKYSKNVPDIDVLIKYEDIKKMIDEYIVSDDPITIKKNSNKSACKDRQWNLGKDIFPYFPFKSTRINVNIIVDGIESTAKSRILFKLTFEPNKQLQDYLINNKDKPVNIELHMNDLDFKTFVPKCKFFDKNGKIITNDNYKIIPVGANWTDNTNILGYHNVITNDYQSTPTYELIKQAIDNPNNPYFLILDEMNLSHVERYFADFLSAIESGEEIPLYGNNETIKLPDNLFIIGTVNVDETTYMFSPKVLDRANTIEFNTLSAYDYMSLELDGNDFEGDIEYLQSPLMDSDICKLNIEDLKDILSEITYDDGNLWDTLARELTGFQETLKGSGFDFGFRVINEILRFMVVAWKYENSPSEWNNWERYFDTQIKQKILPKLHGSQKAIGNVLTDLFNICLENRDNKENPKNFDVTEDNSKYYASALKLQNMVKVLSDQRYVSFIN